MTPKEQVLAKYPQAWSRQAPDGKWSIQNGEGRTLADRCFTANKAWANSVSMIETYQLINGFFKGPNGWNCPYWYTEQVLSELNRLASLTK